MRAKRCAVESSMQIARQGIDGSIVRFPAGACAARGVYLDRALMHRPASFLRVILGLGVLAISTPGLAAASPLGAGGGADWSSAHNGTSITDFYGYGSFTARRTSVALGGLHYDDGTIAASGPLAALVVPVAPAVSARVWATRYLGDGGFRAYRLRGGPEWTLPGSTTLGVFFAYLENNRDGVMRSGSVELAVPLHAQWTGKLEGGASQLPGDLTATQAALGVAWSPIASVELSGEAGLARNGAFLGTASSQSGGGGGPSLLPLGLGGSGGGSRGKPATTTTLNDIEPTVSLGLRFALP